MGTYNLDGKEYTGSHLAVDIKTAKGTPVYAIGNGIVDKTSTQTYGFGHHIVIEHKNFPSFDNPNVKTNYYSSYSHLDSLNVTEGSIVRKGDLIGYVGDSGTATTDHLHFQIDKDTAPWHPYWAFTSSESANAGLSFFEAVNDGLNQSDAIAKTISPISYIQKYGDGGTVSSSSTTTTTTTPDSNTSSTTTDTTTTPDSSTSLSTNSSSSTSDSPTTEETVTTSSPEIEEVVGEPETGTIITSTFEIEQPISFRYGVDTMLEVSVKALDKSKNLNPSFQPDDRMSVELLSGSADITPRYLDVGDFRSGLATIIIKPKRESPIQFRLKSETKMIDSKIIYPGIFADLSKTHPNFTAINYLKDEGIIQGYPDGSFKPENSVSRVEALKFILEGLELKTEKAVRLSFNDTDVSHWYADYVATAFDKGIVRGYPDGSFKPGNTVNKVEFLKMLVSSLDEDIDSYNLRKTFKDVNENAWYTPYMAYAIEKNIIEVTDDTFKPFESMKRESVAEAIYRLKILRLTGADKYSENLDK
jgi:hypothetical protein